MWDERSGAKTKSHAMRGFFLSDVGNNYLEKGRPGLAGERLERTGSWSSERFSLASFDAAKFFSDASTVRRQTLGIG